MSAPSIPIKATDQFVPLCRWNRACFHLQSDLFDQGRVALRCENGQFLQLKQDLPPGLFRHEQTHNQPLQIEILKIL